MIKSMTGYGRSEGEKYNFRCTVEIKSLNHRYCDVYIRMPSFMNMYEDGVRKTILKRVKRGKIDVVINIDLFGTFDVSVNTVATDAYAKALHKLLNRYPVPDTITLALLASYPEAFTINKSVSESERERLWEALRLIVEQATENLVKMRQTEGKALFANILSKRTIIADLIKQIRTRLPQSSLDYETRIRAKVAETLERLSTLGKTMDEGRILFELALFTDRIAIDEELTRLEIHLNQLQTVLSETDSVGRKLDFLLQEMQREINTIASKSVDIFISKLVIDIKSELEKIREQVQNVE
ncbi:MAG: YicC family protein [Turicibacter sp.]|nr:YicC family protein [Turicibacter sp.]